MLQGDSPHLPRSAVSLQPGLKEHCRWSCRHVLLEQDFPSDRYPVHGMFTLKVLGAHNSTWEAYMVEAFIVYELRPGLLGARPTNHSLFRLNETSTGAFDPYV